MTVTHTYEDPAIQNVWGPSHKQGDSDTAPVDELAEQLQAMEYQQHDSSGAAHSGRVHGPPNILMFPEERSEEGLGSLPENGAAGGMEGIAAPTTTPPGNLQAAARLPRTPDTAAAAAAAPSPSTSITRVAAAGPARLPRTPTATSASPVPTATSGTPQQTDNSTREEEAPEGSANVFGYAALPLEWDLWVHPSKPWSIPDATVDHGSPQALVMQVMPNADTWPYVQATADVLRHQEE